MRLRLTEYHHPSHLFRWFFIVFFLLLDKIKKIVYNYNIVNKDYK